MPEVTEPAPRVVSIELPETDRRTPFAVVKVAVGPVTIALGVVLPRSGWLSIRPPLSILGTPAVAIAAVRNDPAAERHMTGHRARRLKTTHGVPDCPPMFQLQGS